MVKAIIFDADHTLYNPTSDAAYRKQFEYIADRLGVDADRLQDIWNREVAQVVGNPDPAERSRSTVLERTLAEMELSPDDRDEIIDEAIDRFWTQVVEDLEYEADVPKLMRALRERGIELVAVASDEFREPLERKLDTIFGDWKDYFEVMVTPRDTGSMKPSKTFFEAVLEHEDIEPSDAAVVGDSWERDLKPARELGMKTVLVAEEEQGEPDVHIRKITELQEVLDEL